MPTEAATQTADQAVRPAKTKNSLEQQIEALEAKARKLKEQLKLDQRREHEKNTKAIQDLLHAEKLEDFSVHAWRACTEEIRKLLQGAKT